METQCARGTLRDPRAVASFLQRLGRTGRRAGTLRNCLFLALDESGLLDAAGLLLQWSRGWVEPVTAPPEPRHIVAQQLLALCLQEHRVGENLWQEWWNGLGPFGIAAEPIARHLVDEGYLDRDGGSCSSAPKPNGVLASAISCTSRPSSLHLRNSPCCTVDRRSVEPIPACSPSG